MDKSLKQPIGHFTIDGEHPGLDGHFPGNPVVPGVVLLDHAMDLLASMHGGSVEEGAIPRVKFLRPVLPGQMVQVSCESTGGRLSFVCEVNGRIVIDGQLVLRP